jgi:hypothetical protein
MRFMVMHYSTEDMEAGVPPTPEHMAAIGEYMEESVKSGVLLAGEGVRPSSYGARVTISDDGKATVTDGPFAEAKELIAGFAILDCKSRDEAIEHAKRWAQVSGSTKIDVRQVAEFSDFE